MHFQSKLLLVRKKFKYNKIVNVAYKKLNIGIIHLGIVP